MKFPLLPLLIFCAFSECSCAKSKKEPEREPGPDERIGQVQAEMTVLAARAAELSDPTTGWLSNDCDAMAWEGERRAASEPSDAPLLAEYPDQPGRFNRRAGPDFCEAGHGSSTSWSRDMADIGLLPWTWMQARRDVLERHVAYGKAHALVFEGFPAWKMGEPNTDGRVVYTPAVIGEIGQMVTAMGGDTGERAWPNVYTAGLTDYEGNLQVMDIWTRGEVSRAVTSWADCPNKDAEDGTISATMYKRLQEHAANEPRNPKYLAIVGKYTGDMGPAITALLDADKPVGSYVRCGADSERCAIAERMFAGMVILRQFGMFKRVGE